MQQVIERAMRLVLTDGGYDMDKVYWSLGHCQGDGACASGSISSEELEKAAHRHIADKAVRNRVIEQIREGNMTVTITQSGRYYHWNSTDVDFGWFGDTDDCDEEAGRQLADDIHEELKGLFRDMEAIGYDIIGATPYEAEPVWCRRSEAFEVVITLETEEYIDLAEEEEYFRQDLAKLAAGELAVAVLAIRVYERDEWGDRGEELHAHLIGGYQYNPKEGVKVDSEIRWTLREALNDARDVLGLSRPERELVRHECAKQRFEAAQAAREAEAQAIKAAQEADDARRAAWVAECVKSWEADFAAFSAW